MFLLTFYNFILNSFETTATYDLPQRYNNIESRVYSFPKPGRAAKK